jgi:hypothetical protein
MLLHQLGDCCTPGASMLRKVIMTLLTPMLSLKGYATCARDLWRNKLDVSSVTCPEFQALRHRQVFDRLDSTGQWLVSRILPRNIVEWIDDQLAKWHMLLAYNVNALA